MKSNIKSNTVEINNDTVAFSTIFEVNGKIIQGIKVFKNGNLVVSDTSEYFTGSSEAPDPAMAPAPAPEFSESQVPLDFCPQADPFAISAEEGPVYEGASETMLNTSVQGSIPKPKAKRWSVEEEADLLALYLEQSERVGNKITVNMSELSRKHSVERSPNGVHRRLLKIKEEFQNANGALIPAVSGMIQKGYSKVVAEGVCASIDVPEVKMYKK